MILACLDLHKYNAALYISFEALVRKNMGNKRIRNRNEENIYSNTKKVWFDYHGFLSSVNL